MTIPKDGKRKVSREDFKAVCEWLSKEGYLDDDLMVQRLLPFAGLPEGQEDASLLQKMKHSRLIWRVKT